MEMQCTHHWPPPEGTPPTSSDSTRTSTLQTNEAQSKSPEPRHRRSGRGRRARRQAQQLSRITEVSSLPCAEMATYRSNTSRQLRCTKCSLVHIHRATEVNFVADVGVEFEVQTTWLKESSPLKSLSALADQERQRKGAGPKGSKRNLSSNFRGHTFLSVARRGVCALLCRRAILVVISDAH